MSLKTNSGYASAVEECERLQRELALAGQNYEALTKESLDTQERLQRELEEARALCSAAALGKSTAEKHVTKVCEERDMLRAGLIETGRIIGCTLADDVSTAFISLGVPAEAKLVLAALRERAERAESAAAVDHEQIATLTQERDALLAALKQTCNPDGCGCISDLPGDNYTCTAHQLLFALLDPADPKKADRK